MEQAARCRRLGIGVTFIAVMMRTNYDRLAEIARSRASSSTRRCGSMSTKPCAATPSRSPTTNTGRGFEALFAQTDVIAIGEPLVRAMAGLPARRGGCGVAHRARDAARHGAALRLLAGLRPGLDFRFAAGRSRHRRYGCPSRRPAGCPTPAGSARSSTPCARRLRRPPAVSCIGWTQPDPYCPVVRGEAPAARHHAWRANRDLPKLESACTTIVVAREGR